jgi:CheY-like chemotaxis protein
VSDKKILAIDDDPVSQYLLRTILSKAGYEVVVASSGSEGLELAERELPALIILDIMMPDIDGTEVAAILRANQKTKDIPIIYLSALITEDEEKISNNKDVPSLIAKPIYRDKLLNEVRKYFNPNSSPSGD